MTTLNGISAAVEEEINICDPKHNLGLGHFNDILSAVLAQVYEHMGSEQRSELNEGDLALIQKLVRRQATEHLASVSLPKLRFEISDRVVCLIGGDRPWAAGKVQACNEPDPSDPTGQVSGALPVRGEDRPAQRTARAGSSPRAARLARRRTAGGVLRANPDPNR